jgi:hypothetical protein
MGNRRIGAVACTNQTYPTGRLFLGGACPRHFMPGYDRTVPTGHSQRLRPGRWEIVESVRLPARIRPYPTGRLVWGGACPMHFVPGYDRTAPGHFKPRSFPVRTEPLHTTVERRSSPLHRSARFAVVIRQRDCLFKIDRSVEKSSTDDQAIKARHRGELFDLFQGRHTSA